MNPLFIHKGKVIRFYLFLVRLLKVSTKTGVDETVDVESSRYDIIATWEQCKSLQLAR